MSAQPLVFPPDFLWGTATAAFQIEGAATTDGRRPSIWDEFCRVPGAILDGSDGSLAVDHYHRHAADVALMASLGVNTYRFSVSWPRVMDGDRVNPAGLDFYSRLVDELLEAGITPWLTLYHWDLPASLPGGWTNRDTAARFLDYTLAVHERLGDRVQYWTTLNEPWCSAFLGYASGEHAPGHTDPVEALRAVHHLLLAHGWATAALRGEHPDAVLGATLNFGPVVPASQQPADLDAARRVDGTANRIFIEPMMSGHYPADVMADLAELWPADLIAEGDLAAIATPIDVLGVNNYTTSMVAAGPPGSAERIVRGRRLASPYPSAPGARGISRGLPRTSMDWEVDAEGFGDLLIRLHETWTGPAGVALVVTENGAAYPDDRVVDGVIDDSDRIDYLRAYLAQAHRAISRGVDLRGYLVWTLIDNFEWAWGYTRTFGLVAVDEGLERHPKASARWFSKVVRSGQVFAQEGE